MRCLLVVKRCQMVTWRWTFNCCCMGLIFSLPCWVNYLLWQSNNKTTFPYTTTSDSFVSKFMLHAKSFPCIRISQTELAPCINTNNTRLLIFHINHHSHCWSHSNTLNFKWIHPFCYFDTETLLHTLVVQDSPQVYPVFHVYGSIEVPARDGFECYFFVFLELFKTLSNFEVSNFCKKEYFEVPLFGV